MGTSSAAAPPPAAAAAARPLVGWSGSALAACSAVPGSVHGGSAGMVLGDACAGTAPVSRLTRR